MRREVWSSLECIVSIWDEPPGGSAIHVANFAQDVRCTQNVSFSKRYQPGKAGPDQLAAPDGYRVEIGAYYIRKAEQVAPLDNPTKRFRVVFQFVNPRYSGVSPEENDTHTLGNAAAQWSLAYQDNDLAVYSVVFEAETHS